MFGLATAQILAWLIEHRPTVDCQPVTKLYETVQKWSADGNDERLPSEREIETQLDLADLIVFSLMAALMSSSGDKPKPRKKIRDKSIEARDRWIYAECLKLTPYDTIALRLKKKPPAWPRIGTKQGIYDAAKKYAKRNNLPPIPPRQE
jgi:hypothetical protein